MLSATADKSNRIERVIRKEDGLYLIAEAGILRLQPKSPSMVRVTYTGREEFSTEEKPGVVLRGVFEEWDYRETARLVCMELGNLILKVNRQTGSITYLDREGKVLLQEKDRESKVLEEFTVYQVQEESMTVERIQTPDGEKEVVREAARIPVGTAYHTRLSLEFQKEEALYGLGQQEEGFGSLRGQTVYLHQANRKIAIPMVVSTLGYGILMDTYSPMIFNDTIYGTYLYTEADREMDYYFIYGGNPDGVVKGYRMLTGKATLLPKWAFGYIQSQERYETREEILQVAEAYRKRGLGLDGIVLDWCSWEGYSWGQKTFDEKRFPNPGKMVEQLHQNHVHFMLSIWPNMGEETDNYKEFKAQKLLLPGCSIYNALSKEARDLYWNQVQRGLYCHGIDAWWCDNSEPFTPEWNHTKRVEPAKMYEEYVRTVANHLPIEQMNAYGLYHAMTLYQGQRSVSEKKRVINLTRSGYTGGQRYGTILWSGDIAATWDTFKRQIAAGLHFCASGLPYWTVDIGAFFVKQGNLWYWKGDYDNGPGDDAYKELFARWFQWGCFLPVFRGHGTDFRRELWQFGEEGTPYYEALKAMNRLRYEFMPYLYSLVGQVWLRDALMMRPLAFAFPEDTKVFDIMDQYLLGDALMVCPVTEAVNQRRVYLPAGADWYDYWTDASYEGGQWILSDAPLHRIPLFVKAGSILPMQAFARSTEEQDPSLKVKVYSGKDAAFTLYEDAGDGYGYEKGEYRLTELVWKEETQSFECRALYQEKLIENGYQIKEVVIVKPKKI